MKLRRDDRAILELFAERFGIGAVRDHAPYGGDNPSVTWLVCATDEIGAAVRLFEAAELRGRKRREFEVWREAAEERAFARLANRHWDRARVRRVAERLAALRPYRDPPDVIATATAATDDVRLTYVDVLRAFAEELPSGELTCTAYANARVDHPEWPTRNTVTQAFGTWERALAAAGLSSRASAWRRERA